ncbi:MAG: DoxX family protein [Gaiellaceae bacterium]
MSYGLLLLRLVLGGIMAGHGLQKLFGWWEGPGPRGTAGMMTNFNFRLASLMVLGLTAAETGGGLLLMLGFLTPLGALAVTIVMFNAVALIHWGNGFWNGKGGYEFNLLIASAAVAIAATGPGRFSLDRALGWDDNISGLWWGAGVLGVAALVSFLTLTAGRRRVSVTEQPVG